MVTKEQIIKTIMNNDNPVENMVLIRLYEYYLKQAKVKETKQQTITAVDIVVAYENINKEFERKLEKRVSPFDDAEVCAQAREYYLLLEDNMNNLEFSNKNRVNNVLVYITYLEALLGIPLSFDIKLIDL